MINISFNDDYSLSINKIQQPKVYENLEALQLQIKKLLLMEKGTYESVPNMGVGIRNYRYKYNEESEALKEEIQQQISTYLPYFTLVEVDIVKIENKIITFNVILDKNILQFKSNTEEKTLSSFIIS